MILEVFCAHDAAVGAFMTPFFARSRGEAIRSFSAAAQDAQHEFGKHGKDYSLYYVGQWNDENGLLSPIDIPDRVCGALDFVPKA